MKIKLIVFSTLFFFISCWAFSQTFMHSLGGTVSVLSAHVKVPSATPGFGYPYSEEYNLALVQYATTYFPRINFETGGNSSFSIGVPLAIGLGSASDVRGANSGVFFSYDLPAVADLNIGYKSSVENERSFGYFFGGGFGYNHVGIALSSGSEKITSYGPLVHAGTKFKMGRSGSLFTGLYYKFGLESQKYKTFGIQILSDL